MCWGRQGFCRELAAASATDHFCILGLSTWSQHSRSRRRRTSCSRHEDRKPSEVFLEFDLHSVASIKCQTCTCSGNGSISPEVHFLSFSLCFSWHLVSPPLPFYFWPGDHRVQLLTQPLPAPVSVTEFWHSLTSIQHSCAVFLVIFWESEFICSLSCKQWKFILGAFISY